MSTPYTLIEGDCIEVMQSLAPNSFDTLISDPPAGVAFMGKAWDHHSRYTPQTLQGYKAHIALTLLQLEPWAAGFVTFTVDWAVEALRLLKPGAPGLVWALPRTSDLTGLGLRLAGFEVRDNVYHLFGSGFPKSHNISQAIDKHFGVEPEIIGLHPAPAVTLGNGHTMSGGKAKTKVPITAPATDAAQEWQGWGTALKPAVEEWILVQKPLEGTYAQNALAHGVAGLNIDGCRITTDENRSRPPGTGDTEKWRLTNRTEWSESHAAGRWPANLVLDESAAALLDQQSGELTSGKPSAGKASTTSEVYGEFTKIGRSLTGYGDTGHASRYFTVLPDESRICYTAKASQSERNQGLDHIDAHQRDASRNADQPSMNGGAGNPYNRGAAPVKNSHPTVKPIELMRWLVRLTKTPKGGHVLDPFGGSGSTGVACLLEGRPATLIERNPEYVEIARYRLEHWQDEASIDPRKLKGKDSDLSDLPMFATGG